ncbi:MAG: hypothetical protein GTN86_09360 [Xanthomonadales bacterium]|nr:hypothetical protein [Xanthomonadales bacterium]NIN60091.1 hypothetical protein [Xanthomonadales bacterium]NIN75461.1 hypothetical protein [Xanthomonadales bacterium]NIO13557.1 hypothetical protein [Xanthomonadales bacterium]NIP12484.1 hypothetical protein [Xanthomonadales bacterium]
MSNHNSEAEFDPFATEEQKPGSRGAATALAGLALIVALAAAAASAYLWWLGRQDDRGEAERSAAVQQLQSAQSGAEQALRTLDGRLSAMEADDPLADLASLRQQLADVQARGADHARLAAGEAARLDAAEGALAELSARTATLETGMAALAARGDTPEMRLDLAEIAYLLRLASERLQLFGDARAADRALAMADEQLAALDDPLYLPVRQQITAARRALEAMPRPDTVVLSQRLAALQARLPFLTFTGERPPDAVAEPAADEGVWARLKRSLAGLVTVRRRVPEDDSVLSLEDKDYIRQGLWLQLETARLALMRLDPEPWSLALGRATHTLERRFEHGDPAVREAMAEVRALQAVELVGTLPDISAPWSQLRLLREGRRSETTVAPNGAPPASAEPVAEPVPAAGDAGG